MFLFKGISSKIALSPMEDLSDFAIAIFGVSPHCQCSISTAKNTSYYYYTFVPKLGPLELKANVLYPLKNVNLKIFCGKALEND